ncbi:MAG: TetR/AcrR family transcriptional regulator C-terminal domain-containing protein [Oscillospiraceae bacterium]|nr:TetR/AcrR family transcriptional regulator C-terminal domain-containing protein [Oscillospiraceae bacterium]
MNNIFKFSILQIGKPAIITLSSSDEIPTPAWLSMDFERITDMAEKKEYRSAIRSRRLIRAALLELLQEKKFEKITVTDIVKRADINRSTFYAHYPDVMGLLEELLEETVNSSIDLVSGIDMLQFLEEPMPVLEKLIAIGEENMEIYKLLGRSDFAMRQVEKMKTVLVENAVGAVNIPKHIRNSGTFNIHMHFFVGGILNVYQQWILGSLDSSPDEIMKHLAELILNNKPMYMNWM